MAKPSGEWKHFAIAFAIALVGYVVLYNVIERRRVARGPWEVTFQTATGHLQLVIQQDSLAIRDVRIEFPSSLVETNLSQTFRFTAGLDVPFTLPFGRCVFQDPLFLPGTTVLEVGGHQLQLMPRVLILDGTEHSWSATNCYTLP